MATHSSKSLDDWCTAQRVNAWMLRKDDHTLYFLWHEVPQGVRLAIVIDGHVKAERRFARLSELRGFVEAQVRVQVAAGWQGVLDAGSPEAQP